MASEMVSLRLFVLFLLITLCVTGSCKSAESESTENLPVSEDPLQPVQKINNQKSQKINDGGGPALMFAEELKQILERYLFGLCPQTFKSRWFQMPLGGKSKNSTTFTCDLDPEQQELAGRLATLALRAHSASRTDCSRFGAALANTLGELARTAANRAAFTTTATNEANKKRKLSKSQKAKIQAKQRTALAVKKKAAAAAAAAAAKMAS
ncbi:uncharacterized protein LOC128201682 isoform X1 [Galleria mellonella]|uniref:Uncharacterized protein LOC128201682 isoform X1 n=1 Tax=Galleria mellonella TaxID=7137 RepID=A0ABM3MVE8_GALME|nr:uncharacterized protein LOC128201682 isoform X1 [Galleria mellonella]